MAERDPRELEKIADSVTDWRRISDHLFKVGPLKIGLDGILTWIPGVGDAYGLGASAFLLVQAARAGASNETLVKMALLLGTDAVVGSVPVAGDLFDMVFRAHARSARILTDEIGRKQKALGGPRAAAPFPSSAAAPQPAPRPGRGGASAAPYPPAPPGPPPPPRRPEPPAHSEEDEWEQARRVEELRAQVRDRGGGIVRPRP